MPLALAAVLAAAALCSLLILPGGSGEQAGAEPSPTASLSRPERVGLADNSPRGVAGVFSSRSSRPDRMPSP